MKLTAHDLYELAVTNPVALAAFFHAAWKTPTVNIDRVRRAKTKSENPILREDFSGSAALARGWAARYGPAIAIDLDAKALKAKPKAKNVTYVVQDCTTAKQRADVIAATNFPLGYFYTRASLVAYLKHVYASLKPGGIFGGDLYGGSDAFQVKRVTQKLKGPQGEKVTYTWEQREACTLTNRVINALHFAVSHGGAKYRLDDAFTYEWRLWSIPELSDALLEVGFAGVDVFERLGDAVDSEGNVFVRPLSPFEPMDDPYVVYVVGRK
jgi:hypothetical protein